MPRPSPGQVGGMDAGVVRRSALVGWRRRVADPVAEALASRSRWSADEVRDVAALTFLALSVYYVITTLRRMAREASRGRSA